MDTATLLNKIGNRDEVVIYGAGIVATGVYTVLSKLYHKTIVAFLVTDMINNQGEIDSVPVMLVDIFKNLEALILVAVPQAYFKEIDSRLQQYGYKNILFIDSNTENSLLREYFKHTGNFSILASDIVHNNYYNERQDRERPSFKIYMAKSHVDKKIEGGGIISEWITPVQAGADLTDEKITLIRDNMGENISAKNQYYSELTVAYWIWKNAKEDYVGLCHYRRLFDIDAGDIQMILRQNCDAVLLYPSIHYPNALNQHIRYLSDTEWQIMWQAITAVVPSKAEEMRKILQNIFFYNFNMVLAKRDVYNKYCTFIFAVLEEAEKIFMKRGIEPQKRYSGYMGEVLTTIFFMYYKDNYKIRHVGKRWLI